MENKQKSKLMNDIENSLDDFFGEQDQEAPTDTLDTAQSLQKLKSAVLSIDWEITDACLADLVNETDALLPVYQNEQTTHALLRMLRALTRYIQKRKAQAHQDAIKRVMSVFASIESLIDDKQLDEANKKRLVAKEILAFKKLKKQVEAQRKAMPAPADKVYETLKQPDVSSLLDNRDFKRAMNEVEERLNAQVKELKSQLGDLQKELDLLRKG